MDSFVHLVGQLLVNGSGAVRCGVVTSLGLWPGVAVKRERKLKLFGHVLSSRRSRRDPGRGTIRTGRHIAASGVCAGLNVFPVVLVSLVIALFLCRFRFHILGGWGYDAVPCRGVPDWKGVLKRGDYRCAVQARWVPWC